MKIKEYFWIYNKYNDNIYILIFIIILLVSFINIFNLYKKKPKSTIKFVKSKFDNTISPSTTSISPSTTSPVSTKYQAPIITNLSNNLFISNDEQAKYKIAKSLLDGNEDSLQNTNGSPNSYMNLPQNDILQMDSTLFTPMYTVNSSSGSIIGNYATLDSLGTGLTDTLGGVNSSLGYAILDEQLGTFNQPNFTNPHVYDNMQTYNTGINANTISGVNTSLDKNFNGISTYGSGYSGKFLQNERPIFLQKDFEGVANIFAPNIIIQNPPLTSDGYPNISFQM